jgi:hypothetical protein
MQEATKKIQELEEQNRQLRFALKTIKGTLLLQDRSRSREVRSLQNALTKKVHELRESKRALGEAWRIHREVMEKVGLNVRGRPLLNNGGSSETDTRPLMDGMFLSKIEELEGILKTVKNLMDDPIVFRTIPSPVRFSIFRALGLTPPGGTAPDSKLDALRGRPLTPAQEQAKNDALLAEYEKDHD